MGNFFSRKQEPTNNPDSTLGNVAVAVSPSLPKIPIFSLPPPPQSGVPPPPKHFFALPPKSNGRPPMNGHKMNIKHMIPPKY